MATVIVAGCGGPGAPKQAAAPQTVSAPGFTFQAPAGWKVERAKSRISATSGARLVQVATFPLQKAYDDKLFGRVAKELEARLREVARQTGGTIVARRTVVADGMRSHAFDVSGGSRVDEYTFVLRGKREYLLLCRRESSDGVGVCKQLVTSFALR